MHYLMFQGRGSDMGLAAHLNRKDFRFEGTFQHVILPRANDLWLLADDHKLSRNRLPGGRGCLDFFKPRALTEAWCVWLGAWARCIESSVLR